MIALPLESGHAALQRGFAEAIFFDDAPIPAAIKLGSGAACASRFGVYRNNVMASLIEALAARFPVTRRLLWPDAFVAVARAYVRADPPRAPVLLEYGDSFPRFLRMIGEGASAEYLADVAELETARVRAYHAADVSPLAREAFAQLQPDRLPDLCVELHPSVTLLNSRFPVVSTWELNLVDKVGLAGVWRPESALIARPHLDVEVRCLPAGAYEMLAALAAGETMRVAIEKGAAAAHDFDLSQTFGAMIAANIVIALNWGGAMLSFK
jgi:hypothetical protein